MTPPIAVVFDRADFVARALAEVLRMHGYAPFTVSSERELLPALHAHRPDILLLDVDTNRFSPVSEQDAKLRLRDVVTHVRAMTPSCRVLATTAGCVEAVEDWQREAADCVLRKPIHADELLRALDPHGPRLR